MAEWWQRRERGVGKHGPNAQVRAAVPHRFVIPDGAADPEPMPLAAVRSNHCNDYTFRPTNFAVRAMEAWVPDIASQFRDDESLGIDLPFTQSDL